MTYPTGTTEWRLESTFSDFILMLFLLVSSRFIAHLHSYSVDFILKDKHSEEEEMKALRFNNIFEL